MRNMARELMSNARPVSAGKSVSHFGIRDGTALWRLMAVRPDQHTHGRKSLRVMGHSLFGGSSARHRQGWRSCQVRQRGCLVLLARSISTWIASRFSMSLLCTYITQQKRGGTSIGYVSPIFLETPNVGYLMQGRRS